MEWKHRTDFVSFFGEPYAILLFLFQSSQPVDEQLRPLGTGETVSNALGDEVSDSVTALLEEIEAGWDAQFLQVGDDVRRNLDGLVGGGVD